MNEAFNKNLSYSILHKTKFNSVYKDIKYLPNFYIANKFTLAELKEKINLESTIHSNAKYILSYFDNSKFLYKILGKEFKKDFNIWFFADYLILELMPKNTKPLILQLKLKGENDILANLNIIKMLDDILLYQDEKKISCEVDNLLNTIAEEKIANNKYYWYFIGAGLIMLSVLQW